MSWDRFDSRQVCVRNRWGDIESLGRIFRHPWDGGTAYGVNVYGASDQPMGTFSTIAQAREYIIAEGRKVSAELGTML